MEEEIAQGELVIDDIGIRIWRVYENGNYLVRLEKVSGSWDFAVYDVRLQRLYSYPDPVGLFGDKMRKHFNNVKAQV